MRPVVLTGPPGSGKSTIAPRLAAALSVPWIDLDREIERRAGFAVAELFVREGAAGFRVREAAVLTDLVARDDLVIAAGGGSLVSQSLRREVHQRATVVGLTAPVEVLLARMSAGGGRPMLDAAHDPEATLRDLLRGRAEGYAEVLAVVDTAALDPDAAAVRLSEAVRQDDLLVPLGHRTYAVRWVSLAGLGDAIAGLSGPRVSAVLLVTDTNVWRHWGETVSRGLGTPPVATVVLRPGERSKTVRGVSRLWDAALGAGIDRDALVVAVGGGVVTDLGGFAAATLLRGIRWLAVPTSLLGMVDAAVGGKTGVDMAQGKNLVGAFHHPSAVLVDPETLSTLPRGEYLQALAEVVKIAVVRDPGLLVTLEREAGSLVRPGGAREILSRVIRAAVRAKAGVVSMDEREHGERAVLNFGHTVGHALEAGSGYTLSHGVCVAVGIRAALGLGCLRGMTPVELCDRVGALLDMLGLPRRMPVPYALAETALFSDKKRSHEGLRFVLVRAPGQAVTVVVPLDEARWALQYAIETRSTP